MEAYKQEFVDFMLDCGVLKFGDFTLKSGRRSPLCGSNIKTFERYFIDDKSAWHEQS